MASLLNILICGGVALILFTGFGLPLAIRILPRPLAPFLAPGIGWAVHSAVALPVFFLTGLSRVTVIAAVALPAAAALGALWIDHRQLRESCLVPRAGAAALLGAAILAFAVMAGVVPKFSVDGVSLAAPIFDHSKVAMVDEMIRLGVPPGNPFFGGPGSPARLSYYYLWHFSAAELALLTHASGWEADAGLTGFTAFATLAAMIGLAVWLSGRASAGLWLAGIAATASLRPLLNGLFGIVRVEEIAGYQSGFGGWLFQASWAPQHVASAMCAVLATFLLIQLRQRQSVLAGLTFALVMAAGFESSTWVGGVVFPGAAIAVSLLMLGRSDKKQRVRVVLFIVAAAVLAMLLIAPFVYDQLRMTAMRGDGPPIVIMPYRVFGEATTAIIGNFANLPAFWLIFLPIEFPGFYIAGVVSLVVLLRNVLAPELGSCVRAFALLLAVSLAAAWLLVSTLGENNDLGWRAVLPAAMLLMVLSAVGLSGLTWRRFSPALLGGLALIVLGLPEGVSLIYGNFVAAPNASSKVFAASPALWQAVRRQSASDERVANNPFFLEYMTPWSVNISWALLSNRRSCYANQALVGPFSALSQARSDQIDAKFKRVFAGSADPDDIVDLATQFNCSVAVVTPQDGAWSRDPFASSPYYRLVESASAWRIYKLVKLASR